VPQIADREVLVNPYIVEINEQLEGYIGVHRFVTAEVRDYQERKYQGTPMQAALSGIFFEACYACGSGTTPVELIELTKLTFNRLAQGCGQDTRTRELALKLEKVSGVLALSPALMSVPEKADAPSSDDGLQSLAGCFADSFLYAHTVLDSVSGNRPDSVFTPADWTVPSKAQRIMNVCANA
jgi:hypothetical protein